MSERLYQYAVILHPTQEDAKSGVRAEIIVQPTNWLLARSADEALMFACRDSLLAAHMRSADRLEVIVLPFGGSPLYECVTSGRTIAGSL